jgi:transcriptional regulator with XRE-family HTH domain|tara:strand:- start:352 stop:912 length:561 start_codon:yes stop_codon:yes gene_type:complete
MEANDPEFNLGKRLKELREMHNLSQRELAKRATVSNAVISLIERNETSPSVGMLKKVLDGIPISMTDFFALEQSTEQVFFDARELVEIASGAISYRQVGRDLRGKAIQLLHERYQPGADTGDALLRHEAEEGGVVIAGELELTVGGQRKVLKAGDAYYFDSRTPHRFRNLGAVEAVVVSACSPPSF